MPSDSLSITDNRTGETYELPIEDGTIRAMDLRQIKVSDDDFGHPDPRSGRSRTRPRAGAGITFVDGEKENPALPRLSRSSSWQSHSDFLETAHTSCCTESFPNPQEQLKDWEDSRITHYTMLHENIKKFMDGFHHDAHPMGMLVSTVGGAVDLLSPGRERTSSSPEPDELQMHRLIGEDADAGGLRLPAQPRPALRLPRQRSELRTRENFLSMLWKATETEVQPDPVLERALDVLFILHADHEQNCSTNTMRSSAARGRPILLLCDRGRHRQRSTDRSTAAPTKPCSRC